VSQVQPSEKEKAMETLSTLTPQEKTKVTLGFMNDLPASQLQQVVEAGVNNLSASAKDQVAKNTGLRRSNSRNNKLHLGDSCYGLRSAPSWSCCFPYHWCNFSREES
jgi:hypothetical protein